MMFRPFMRVAFLAAMAALPLSAQDVRDVVTRTDGKVVTGRVAVPTAPEQLLVLQGGKRVRVDRADVAELDLVGDRVREFYRRRVKLKDNAKAQWFLVDWASSHALPGLAHAQALLLVLDHDLPAAHEFLGHRETSRGWLWLYDGRHLTRERFAERVAKKGLTIAGERFAVRCRQDLRACTAALLDLEHFGVVFYERFGEGLQLAEVLEPVLVDVAVDAERFLKWGFRPIPWFDPPPHGDVGRTFFASAIEERPDKLFFVGTQGLLYRGLIGEASRQNDRDRVCAWLEVGLGMHMQNTMQGPAGFAAPGEPQEQARLALTALGRTFRLSSLLHLPMYGGYYLLDDTATAIHWASSAMFAAWLLDEGNDPPTRDRFLRYVREALGDKKGDSSSLFDQVMGSRIEELEKPWTAWLTKQAK